MHKLPDDRESSFYVILYLVLRFSKDELAPSQLDAQLKIFDEFVYHDDLPASGSRQKRDPILTGLSQNFYAIRFNKPLDETIKDVLAFLQPRYNLPTKEDKAQYDKLEAQGATEEFIIEYSPYVRHKLAKRKFKQRGVWVALLRKHLDEPDWPDRDYHKHTIGTGSPHRNLQGASRGLLLVSAAGGRAYIPKGSHTSNKRVNWGSAASAPTRPDEAAFEAGTLDKQSDSDA